MQGFFFFKFFFMDHLFISGLLTGRVSLWESNTVSETKVIREDESPSLFIKKKKNGGFVQTAASV